MRRRLAILSRCSLPLPWPNLASAIQPHWSNGADTISFTTATRRTVLVQADSAESQEPPRLGAVRVEGLSFG